MRAARSIITAFANVLAVSGLGLLLILAVFTLLDGLLRALAGMPIDLVREIGDMVAAIAGACCLPIALLQHNNIVLRTFDRILPTFTVRLIDTLAAFVVAIVMLGIAWQFYLFSLKTMRAGDVTWLLNWPKAPFWFIVDAILWVAATVQGFVLIEEMINDRKPRDPESVA
jgi:TRAP-type C4-dicarboxylate transport system permease small subunit